MRTLSVGKATATVMNVGDFMWNLPEKMSIAESDWRPRYAAFFERPQRFPTQGIHIALPGASVIIAIMISRQIFSPPCRSINHRPP